jgi:uncharacterized DUF497 family protein
MEELIKICGFDWDLGNLNHCSKHGVTKAEIEELFRSGPAIAPDIRHSDKEDRFLAVGRTAKDRALFVVFLFRMKAGNRLIRPISARYMHPKEVKAYEKACPKT